MLDYDIPSHIWNEFRAAFKGGKGALAPPRKALAPLDFHLYRKKIASFSCSCSLKKKQIQMVGKWPRNEFKWLKISNIFLVKIPQMLQLTIDIW